MILIALTSLTLNSIVFKHHYGKKKSIARDLFLGLSMTDFLSCVVIPVNFTVGLLRPKEVQCKIDHNATFCQTRYYEYYRSASLSEKIVGCFVWYLMFNPYNITCALAICRWYQVSFPLRQLNRKIALFILAAFSVLVAIYLSVKLLSEPSAMVVAIQTVISFSNLITIDRSVLQLEDILVILLTFTAILASVLTGIQILKPEGLQDNRERRARKIKCTIKIGLLNLGNIVFIAVLLSLSFTREGTIENLRLQTTSCLISTVQSTFNPAVYILLTNGALNTVARVKVHNIAW